VLERNAAPTISSLSLPRSPVPVLATAQVTGECADANRMDSHTGAFTWGDGTTSTASVADHQGACSVSGTHAYQQTGVFTVSLTISDGLLATSRASTADLPSYVVVYDPDGSFVTGGGWITSPAGAYSPQPAASGKATFGFVSKYPKGRSVPEGNTEFSFAAAQFKFVSTSYDWLVVSGRKATYRGSGLINGSGDYRFTLSAIDGDVTGGGGVDRFRLKIWDAQSGGLVYDNQAGSADDADPTTAIAGGSIVVHK
jgi:hypothetical protein